MPGEYNQVALDSRFAAIGERLARIEAQLEALSESTGVPYERPMASVPEEVVELARTGKTLEAVKRYRELTGASMEDAKAAVAGA